MVVWLFEDFEKGVWFPFELKNQAIIERAWLVHQRQQRLDNQQTSRQSNTFQQSSPPPSTNDNDEPAAVDVQDQHFDGLVTVFPGQGLASAPNGDLLVARVDNSNIEPAVVESAAVIVVKQEQVILDSQCSKDARPSLLRPSTSFSGRRRANSAQSVFQLGEERRMRFAIGF